MLRHAKNHYSFHAFTAECDNVPSPTEDANRYVDGPPGHPLAFKNRMYEEEFTGTDN